MRYIILTVSFAVCLSLGWWIFYSEENVTMPAKAQLTVPAKKSVKAATLEKPAKESVNQVGEDSLTILVKKRNELDNQNIELLNQYIEMCDKYLEKLTKLHLAYPRNKVILSTLLNFRKGRKEDGGDISFQEAYMKVQEISGVNKNENTLRYYISFSEEMIEVTNGRIKFMNQSLEKVVRLKNEMEEREKNAALNNRPAQAPAKQPANAPATFE